MAVNLEMSVQLDAPNYQNVEKPRIKTCPATDTQHAGAYRLAGVCVGLMCIVQATLNIVLRLFFSSPVAVEMLQTNGYNHTLTTSPEQLQRRYDDLIKEKEQLNFNYNILRLARNQLQMEKDKLQSKLSNIAESLKNPGWVMFSSSLYYMSTEQKNWHQSREDCKKKGADLVIIERKEEQEFVEMFRRGKETWIGLTDKGKENVWRWVDGTPLNVKYWLTQEPNNYLDDEDCVTSGYIPEDGRDVLDVLDSWNDNSCITQLFWMCEKKLSL